MCSAENLHLHLVSFACNLCMSQDIARACMLSLLARLMAHCVCVSLSHTCHETSRRKHDWGNTGVASLASCSSLTSLNLAVCRELTDAGVRALTALSRLSKLDLTFCDRLTDAVVPHLARSATPLPPLLASLFLYGQP